MVLCVRTGHREELKVLVSGMEEYEAFHEHRTGTERGVERCHDGIR